eukprot:531021_1
MVRLALVGTGRMASVQFKNITNHPIAQCNYVISNTLTRSQQFLKENVSNLCVQASDDLELTLKQNGDNIDGVIITSSSQYHYTQVKQCLLHNKPVFVEKPIAESLSEIDELYSIASNNNLPPILVGHQRRFDPNIRHLYKQIHENNALLPSTNIEGLTPTIGGIEKIISISRDPTYPNVDYITGSINGFYDSIIHDIDIICYLTKQYPNKVYTAAHSHYKPINKLNDFDRIFITLHFESGLLGMIDWCRHSGFSYDQRLNVLGYNGMLEITNKKENLLIKHNNNGKQMAKPMDYFLERYNDAYNNEINEFVEIIQGKKEVNTTHKDMRNVNIVVAAAEKSAHSGQPVDIYYQFKEKL